MDPHLNPPLPSRIQQPKPLERTQNWTKGTGPKVMEVGEIDTQQKHKKLLDADAEELC